MNIPSRRDYFYRSLRLASAYSLSRLIIASQSFIYGVMIEKIQVPGAVAAAPVMFNIQQFFFGMMRGNISAVVTITGTLNGAKRYREIGPAGNQGLLLGVLLGLPVSMLFFFSESVLNLVGIDTLVARQSGEFLRGVSYGVIPTFWSFSDQCMLMGLHRTLPPIILNALFTVLTVGICFPAALFSNSIAPIGWGTSLAALAVFLAGRAYLFFNKTDGVLDREQYQFFSLSLKSGTSFKGVLSLSLPVMLQALSEWLPITLIALLTATFSSSQTWLSAEQAANQVLLVTSQVIGAISSSATILVSNERGRLLGDMKTRMLEPKEAVTAFSRIAWGTKITGLVLMAVPAVFCVSFPNLLFSLFSPGDTSVREESFNITRIAGATLLIDVVRMVIIGNVIGLKSPVASLISAVTNLLAVSSMTALPGYFMVKNFNSPVSFYGMRTAGMGLSMLLLSRHLERQSVKPLVLEKKSEEKKSEEKKSADSTARSAEAFRPAAAVSGSVIHPDHHDQEKALEKI